jgi:hypothetical protein
MCACWRVSTANTPASTTVHMSPTRADLRRRTLARFDGQPMGIDERGHVSTATQNASTRVKRVSTALEHAFTRDGVSSQQPNEDQRALAMYQRPTSVHCLTSHVPPACRRCIDRRWLRINARKCASTNVGVSRRLRAVRRQTLAVSRRPTDVHRPALACPVGDQSRIHERWRVSSANSCASTNAGVSRRRTGCASTNVGVSQTFAKPSCHALRVAHTRVRAHDRKRR